MLATSILTEAEFDNLSIAERPALLGDWFKAGDTGFIYGKRGLGKSWLALSIARALLKAVNVGLECAARRVECFMLMGRCPLMICGRAIVRYARNNAS